LSAKLKSGQSSLLDSAILVVDHSHQTMQRL